MHIQFKEKQIRYDGTGDKKGDSKSKCLRKWFTKINECHQRTRQAVSVSEEGVITKSENLVKPKTRLEVRRNFFSCRVVEPWNHLPPGVQEAADVQDFKMKYDEFIAGN